jgi:hypothetical protein
MEGLLMVDEEVLQAIFHGLRSRDPIDLTMACYKAIDHASRFSPDQTKRVADGLLSLFYLDPTDHPELVSVIDAAVDALVALGPGAIDVLIGDLTDADLKANILIGRTLSRMGHPAVAALIERFRRSHDPYQRTFALFAMAKIEDASLIDVFPEVVDALDDDHAEMRDTAARAIGKLLDSFGGQVFPKESTGKAYRKLMTKLSDPHPGTRSKAVRSIGKLAKAGCLDKEETQQALAAMSAILGTDGHHEWDRAFNVRREAEEAWCHLMGKELGPDGQCPDCPSPK